MSDTIKIRFGLNIGLSGCQREEVVEYDRATWNHMSEEEKENEVAEWAHDYVDCWFQEEE